MLCVHERKKRKSYRGRNHFRCLDCCGNGKFPAAMRCPGGSVVAMRFQIIGRQGPGFSPEEAKYEFCGREKKMRFCECLYRRVLGISVMVLNGLNHGWIGDQS